MKQYACLGCGLVHDGKKTMRERVDTEGSGPGPGGFKIHPWHGFMTWRICPECDSRIRLKEERD